MSVTPYRWRDWKAAVRAAGATKGVTGTANALVLFASHATGDTTVGLSTLREESGYEDGTTLNHLRWLSARGLLTESRSGSVTTYTLTTPASTLPCTPACVSHASVHATVEIPRQDGNPTPALRHSDASVGPTRGVPYEHQEHQERSQPAGAPAPVRAHAREPAGQPHAHGDAGALPASQTADPWPAVTDAVLTAYGDAIEKRTGGASRGRAIPKFAADVVANTREALPAPARDDPAKVTAAAVHVTRFFAKGFPHDRGMPHLWRLAKFETFTRQWDMAQESDGAPAKPRPPPNRPPLLPPEPPDTRTPEEKEADKAESRRIRDELLSRPEHAHLRARRLAP